MLDGYDVLVLENTNRYIGKTTVIRSTRESLGEERVLCIIEQKYGEMSVKSFPFHNSQSLVIMIEYNLFYLIKIKSIFNKR